MHKKPSWVWTVFFFTYIFTVVSATALFFEKNSPSQTYYQILFAFNSLFLMSYLFHVLALALDILAIIPFYIYIKPEIASLAKRYFSSGIWKWLFALRAALLVVGHSYDYKQLQSLYLNNSSIVYIAIGLSIFVYAPSYFANLVMSFRQEK